MKIIPSIPTIGDKDWPIKQNSGGSPPVEPSTRITTDGSTRITTDGSTRITTN